MNIIHEHLGPAFEKWHLNHVDAPSPEFPDHCRPVIHALGVDDGPPHDHPWSFHTFCLCGGYEEEVFFRIREIKTGRSYWQRELRQFLPGQAMWIPATHVHRVVRLLDGPCRTITLYGPHEQEVTWYPELVAPYSGDVRDGF